MEKRRIYKYEIEIIDEQILTLPKDSKILSIINQHEKVYIYVDVDSYTQQTEDYYVQLYGTGYHIRHDDSYIFLGTISLKEGDFILHAFYKKIE